MLNVEEFLVFGVDVSKDELVLYDGSRHYRVGTYQIKINMGGYLIIN